MILVWLFQGDFAKLFYNVWDWVLSQSRSREISDPAALISLLFLKEKNY